MDVSVQLHNALSQRQLFVQAVRASDLDIGERFRLRIAYALPKAREAIDEYIVERLLAEPNPEAMADGSIIEFIIEYLPEILALIKIIIGLF